MKELMIQFVQIVGVIIIGGVFVWGIITTDIADIIKSLAISLLLFAIVLTYVIAVIEPRIKKLEGDK